RNDLSGQFNGWDTTTGKSVFAEKLDYAFSSGDYSPDGKFIALGIQEPWFSMSGGAYIADARTGKRKAGGKLFDSSCTSVRFTPDGKRLLAGTHDGRVVL